MEVSTFPKPEVREQKENFVEARLHADTKDDVLRARIAGLVDTVAKSTAQPIYVVIDPKTEVEVDRYKGAPLTASLRSEFIQFLKDMNGALHE